MKQVLFAHNTTCRANLRLCLLLSLTLSWLARPPAPFNVYRVDSNDIIATNIFQLKPAPMFSLLGYIRSNLYGFAKSIAVVHILVNLVLKR